MYKKIKDFGKAQHDVINTEVEIFFLETYTILSTVNVRTKLESV